jgi:PKHD-type hydroxylase
VLHGIHDIQVIRYNVDSFYDKHLDIKINESNQQRKLTFVIQLSDSNDYTGGDLILHADNQGRAVSRNKGSIAVFPSFTLHEVSRLTSGIRYSMIGWCFGPEFK